MLIVFVFLVLPIILSLALSFTDWNALNWKFHFVGLHNYRFILATGAFWQVIGNTLFLTLVYTVLLNVLALIIASVVYRMKQRIGSLCKSAMFLPNLLAPVVVGFIWLLMYQYSNGIINKILGSFGVGKINWLGSPHLVLPSISVTCVWFALGYYLMIYIAGMTTIPKELYECADVEGANGFQKFFKITLPMLAPSITINVILSTIGALAIFEEPMVMTNGGPGNLSETLGLQIYHMAYTKLNQGAALATAMFMIILALIIAFAEFAILKRREDIY